MHSSPAVILTLNHSDLKNNAELSAGKHIAFLLFCDNREVVIMEFLTEENLQFIPAVICLAVLIIAGIVYGIVKTVKDKDK